MYLTDRIFFVGIKDYRLFVRTSATRISTYVVDLILTEKELEKYSERVRHCRLAWTLICTTTHQTMRLSAVEVTHWLSLFREEEKKKEEHKEPAEKPISRDQEALQWNLHILRKWDSSENKNIAVARWREQGAFMDYDWLRFAFAQRLKAQDAHSSAQCCNGPVSRYCATCLVWFLEILKSRSPDLVENPPILRLQNNVYVFVSFNW